MAPLSISLSLPLMVAFVGPCLAAPPAVIPDALQQEAMTCVGEAMQVCPNLWTSEVPFCFEAVSLDEADSILRVARSSFDDLCSRIGPVSASDLFVSERLLGLNLIDGFVRG